MEWVDLFNTYNVRQMEDSWISLQKGKDKHFDQRGKIL